MPHPPYWDKFLLLLLLFLSVPPPQCSLCLLQDALCLLPCWHTFLIVFPYCLLKVLPFGKSVRANYAPGLMDGNLCPLPKLMAYFSIHPSPLKCSHVDNLPPNEGPTVCLCDVSLVGGGPDPSTTDESPTQWLFILQCPVPASL